MGESTAQQRSRPVLALLGKAAVGMVVAAFLAVFFVIPGPLINTAADAGPGIAFAEVDGRDVAIVSYADHGFGGASFFLPWQQDARVVALDVDTGETVWDRGIAGEGGELTVLAAGEQYAYLRGPFDLTVIALSDGSVVAHTTDIAGLEDFETFQAEIIFSARQNAIMLRPEEGAVHAIVLDTLAAVEVDARTDATWGCVLDWRGHTYFADTPEPVLIGRIPVDGGAVDGGALGFGLPSGAAPGTPGTRLSRTDSYGGSVAAGSQTFVNGRFVAESVRNEPRVGACPTAQWQDDVFPEDESSPVPLGVESASDSGFVVIEHDVSARDDARAISVVDHESGEVLGTIRADWGVEDARRAPGGGAVAVVQRFVPGVLPGVSLPISATVVLVANDGSVREVVLAKHGWLGLPW